MKSEIEKDNDKTDIGLDELIPAFQAADMERRRRVMKILVNGETDATLIRGEQHQEKFLNQMEIAAHLGIHPCTVRRWKLPHHRLSRVPRYLVSEVTTYLDSEAFQARLTEIKGASRAA